MINQYEELIIKLPFLSYGEAYGKNYVGVLNARSKTYVSMFLIDNFKSSDELKEFLNLAERWWWNCNRNIPISIYFSKEMEKFEHAKKIFLSKDYTLLGGNEAVLSNIAQKRIKRCVKLLK